jgi:hypothetical protein
MKDSLNELKDVKSNPSNDSKDKQDQALKDGTVLFSKVLLLVLYDENDILLTTQNQLVTKPSFTLLKKGILELKSCKMKLLVQVKDMTLQFDELRSKIIGFYENSKHQQVLTNVEVNSVLQTNGEIVTTLDKLR